MLEPLHAPDWYRVADLRLRLRQGVGVSRQVVRGQVWHVLTDPTSGRHHRFNDSAYRFIAACNGQATLDEIWQAELAALGDAAPTQGETIRIVAQAHAAHLLIGQIAPDAAELVKGQSRTRRQRQLAQANPLAFRVRLWNPNAFLARHLAHVRPVLSGPARALAWLVVAVGALLLAVNAGDLTADARQQLSAPRVLLMMWLVYPLLKAVHELAHAFTVKAHGGEVVEIGVTLLMLTPVPYVDASASIAFADKRARAAVSSAGILVEAVAATAALIGWLLLQPGLARELCLAVVTVGALSTLLVNGNPLMRFDGYHWMVDALELPNLAPRSARWWKRLLQRHLLRMPQARMDGLLPGEARWLAAYAPLAWAWRLVLLAGLAVALAQWSAVLGLVLLAAALWLCLIKPVWGVLRWAWQSPEAAGQRGRAAALFGAVGALAAVMLFAVPLPERTHAPAVVWLPDEAILRLHSDARVEEFLVADGQPVTAGTPVVRLSNEELELELARVRADMAAAEVEQLAHFELQAGRSAMAQDDLARLRVEAQRLQQQVEQLTLRAGVDGRAVIDQPQRWLGRWLPQGQTLAHVLPPGAPMVRALVRNEDVSLVRERPGEARVALAQSGGEALVATLTRAVPMASNLLPTPALGDGAGGPIAIDRRDGSGRTASESRFVFDLTLPAGVDARVGSRAMVTFTHGSASAAEWLGRAWRQAFLRHFER